MTGVRFSHSASSSRSIVEMTGVRFSHSASSSLNRYLDTGAADGLVGVCSQYH